MPWTLGDTPATNIREHLRTHFAPNWSPDRAGGENVQPKDPKCNPYTHIDGDYLTLIWHSGDDLGVEKPSLTNQCESGASRAMTAR